MNSLKIGQLVFLRWHTRHYLANVVDVDPPGLPHPYAKFKFLPGQQQDAGESWDLRWRLANGALIVPLDCVPTKDQLQALIHLLT